MGEGFFHFSDFGERRMRVRVGVRLRGALFFKYKNDWKDELDRAVSSKDDGGDCNARIGLRV